MLANSNMENCGRSIIKESILNELTTVNIMLIMFSFVLVVQ